MEYPIILTKYNNQIVDTKHVMCQNDAGQTLVILGLNDSRNAKIIMTRSDNSIVERSLTKQDNGTYTYVLKSEDLAVCGRVICDVKHYDSESRESSQIFFFEVRQDTLSNYLINTQSYSDTLNLLETTVNNQINSIISQMNAAYESINNVIENKVGIVDSEENKSTTTAYSSDYMQTILDQIEQNMTPTQIDWTPELLNTSTTQNKTSFGEALCIKMGKLVYCSIRIDTTAQLGGYLGLYTLPIVPTRGINMLNMSTSDGNGHQWYIDVAKESNNNKGCIVLRDLFPAGRYYFNFTYFSN